MNTFITVWVIAAILSFVVSIFLYVIDVVDGKFVVLYTAIPPVLIVVIIMLIVFSFINCVLNIKTNKEILKTK